MYSFDSFSAGDVNYTGHLTSADLIYLVNYIFKSGPASIYWLWAIISLAGFPLHDVCPDRAAIFWPIAGTLGGVLSLALGMRWGRRSGQGSARIARYHAMHWSGMMVCIGLCVVLVIRGVIAGEALPEVVLILVVFGWFSAGIYLVREYIWMRSRI